MGKKKTDYERVILRIHTSWKFLKSHPEKETKGVDGESIESFTPNERSNIRALREELRKGTFSFKEMKPVSIGTREILVCTIRDRIVMRSVLSVIKPHFKKVNSNCDFSRPVKYRGSGGPYFKDIQGVPLAAKVIQENIRAGYVWVFETDIKKFFDNIPKDKIFQLIKKEVRDEKVLALVEAAIKFQVKKEEFDFDGKDYRDDTGVAQGSAISPLLAGIYLNDFDNFIKANKNVRLVRYVDDFIIQCKTQEDAEAIYETVRKKMKGLGLEIHPLNTPDKGKIKTKIVRATQDHFTFLGLTFNAADINISDKKQEAFIEKVNEIISDSKLDLPTIIKKVRNKLYGFILQYSHPHYTRTPLTLDSLICGSQDKVKTAFIRRYVAITGSNPFRKLNDVQQSRLLRFFGIDFSDLRSKPKKQKTSPKKSGIK